MPTQAINGSGLLQPASSGPPPRAAAEALVARATDGRTGHVDTAKLAGWVTDAAARSPHAASEAHAAIEAHLGLGDRSRFNADVAAAFRREHNEGVTYSATGAAHIATAAGGRILRDNPILKVQWRSTISPVTNRSGFSGPLQKLLTRSGIETDLVVKGVPPGAVIARDPAANTHNGNAARDAVATEMRASGEYTHVATEATENTWRSTSLGRRQVDVVATARGSRPEMNIRVEVESKLGRASASAKTQLQVAKDAERLVENAHVRRLGSVLEGVGKVARPVGIALDVVQVGRAFHEDGNRVGDRTEHAVGGVAGGAAGAWGGAEAGAAVGSLAGPVGTVVGGLVGGAVGGVVGSGIGDKAVGWAKQLF